MKTPDDKNKTESTDSDSILREPVAAYQAQKKMTFEEAAAACEAITVDEFFDELLARIDNWDDNNEEINH